jgi:hypothetical protein
LHTTVCKPLSLRAIELVLLCLLLSSTSGCGTRAVKSLGELAIVRGEIIKRFGEEDVDIHQNSFSDNTSIAITFINSSLNDKSQEEREKRAQETAQIVKAHHKSISQIDAIFVSFVRRITVFAVFHYSEALGTFGFDRDARSLKTSDETESPLSPTARYSEPENQTEVSLGGLQLEGVAGDGLTLVPHFKLAGDAIKKQSASPEAVGFDFASYGTKSKFPGLTRVRLIADEKVLFAEDGQFSTSRTRNDQVSEFLYLTVPYSTFRKMVAGNEVRIVLGDHDYKLERLQVFALRNMTAYVRN